MALHPKDVIYAASELARKLEAGEFRFGAIDALIAAILAERERCATAVAAIPGMGDYDCCGGFERCRDDAIEAIRGAQQ